MIEMRILLVVQVTLGGYEAVEMVGSAEWLSVVRGPEGREEFRSQGEAPLRHVSPWLCVLPSSTMQRMDNSCFLLPLLLACRAHECMDCTLDLLQLLAIFLILSAGRTILLVLLLLQRSWGLEDSIIVSLVLFTAVLCTHAHQSEGECSQAVFWLIYAS